MTVLYTFPYSLYPFMRYYITGKEGTVSNPTTLGAGGTDIGSNGGPMGYLGNHPRAVDDQILITTKLHDI